jgi:hypothetical protein
MIKIRADVSDLIEIVKIFFTISVILAFFIILIFNRYRNKYLTLTKNN